MDNKEEVQNNEEIVDNVVHAALDGELRFARLPIWINITDIPLTISQRQERNKLQRPIHFQNIHYKLQDAWDMINNDTLKDSYFTRTVLFEKVVLEDVEIPTKIPIWPLESLSALVKRRCRWASEFCNDNSTREELIDIYAQYILLV